MPVPRVAKSVNVMLRNVRGRQVISDRMARVLISVATVCHTSLARLHVRVMRLCLLKMPKQYQNVLHADIPI